MELSNNDVNIALGLIDSLIKYCSGRGIVPANEVTDSLLDIRLYLMGIAEGVDKERVDK